VSLWSELRRCKDGEVPQELAKRIRNALANSRSDDEEVDFLMQTIASKDPVVKIDPLYLPHLLDFLHGEIE
jgi:hypothetical protein